MTDPASPEGMLRSYDGENDTGLSAIREKPVDDRSVFQQIRDYLNKGINEDARYVLGPHAAPALTGLGSLLGEILGPGADVRDAVTASGETTQAVKEGDILGAGVGGLNTLASLAMMALPGSVGGAKKITQEVSENLPEYKKGLKSLEIEEDLFKDVLKTSEGDPVVVYRGTNLPRDNNGKVIEEILEGKGRSDYATFTSDNPNISETYIGKDEVLDEGGVMIPFLVKPKKVIEYEDRFTRKNAIEPNSASLDFDIFEFDRQAQKLKEGEVLVVRNVRDSGGQGTLEGPALDKRYTSYGGDIYAVKDENVLVSAISPLTKTSKETTPGSVKNVREASENIYKKPVFHSTRKAKEIEDADEIYFVSPNPSADIGFHVSSSPLSANQRIMLYNSRQDELRNITKYEKNDPSVAKALKDSLDKRYEDQSNLLLKLKDNINPVRVPDVSNFKNPINWAETIAISKKDFPDKFKSELEITPSYGVDPLIINYKGDKLIVSPKYLQDIMDNEGKINKEYMEDLVKLVYKSKDKVLSKKDKFDPQSSVKDRREWFEQLKEVNKKYGYDSFIYKNEYEGFDSRSARFDPKTGETEVIKDRPEKAEDSLMLMYPNQVKYATATEFNPNKKQLSKKQGGSVIERNPYNYPPRSI
jgi:hypothetical protein